MTEYFEEQLGLALDEPQHLRLYCRIPGQPLASWDGHFADIEEARDEVKLQLAEANVRQHGPVLALVVDSSRVPVANTPVD